MGFLLREENEEKQKLFREYNLLREDLLDRSFKTWVITIVLIVGSLLVAFAPGILSFPTPILSLLLIALALILHSTSERVSAIGYNRLYELENQLKITGPNRMYEFEIAGKWWYTLRRNVAYGMFDILIGVYLFLLANNIWVLAIAIAIGIVPVLLKETRPYEKTKAQIRYH